MRPAESINATSEVVDPVRDTSWRMSAVCAQVDPEIFFPEKGGSAAPAKRICLGCPVKEACKQFAIATNQTHGIWGATLPQERAAIRRELGLSRTVAA